jgi:GrpB-like predicted nucleotidyltransferase (UPF0157 family)
MQKVEVIDYQDSWGGQFDAEAGILSNAIRLFKPNIHHIGSTSIVGLAAKPIIDILIEVDDVGSLDDHSELLKAVGYHGRGENGIRGRRYFEKGDDDRTYQIHAFNRGSMGVIRHLAFRDYLRHHPQIAHEYVTLKKEVASTCNNDIDLYCDGKNQFIQEHEKLAIEWYSHNKRMQSDPAKPHRR